MFDERFMTVVGKEGVVSIVACGEYMEFLLGFSRREPNSCPSVRNEKDPEKS
jgi:hypothetical protein